MPVVAASDPRRPGLLRARAVPFWLAAVAALSIVAAGAASAQQTHGGDGGSSHNINIGGVSSVTGPGSDGLIAPNAVFNGGGGGGAGVLGGRGGFNFSSTAPGGAGGFAPGMNGDNSTGHGGSGGGGGGGGGAHGGVVTTDAANAGTLTGGSGGNGGDALDTGAGGGGGAGGFGVVVDGSGLTYTNADTGVVRGGNGGKGGNNSQTVLGGDGYGGNGGDGGIGVFVNGGSSLSNAGSIAGGNGGKGGDAKDSARQSAAGDGGNGGAGIYMSGPGTVFNSGSITGGHAGAAGDHSVTPLSEGQIGAAGAGIVGAGLTVINSGTIAGGGAQGVNVNQPNPTANAITFTGGSNVLELWATSVITDNIVGTGTDTLRLGGAADGTFDVSAIGPAAQYQGFAAFVKTGSSTWTLTGTTTAVTPWQINQGTLAVSSDANLGAASGGLSFNGGTLRFLAGFSTSRAITLNGGGGTVDTNGNDATLAGDIGGTGGLTKNGTGTLTLTGTSSYTGPTQVNGGTLQAGTVGAFSSASAFTAASGATLDLNNFDQTIGSLAGGGSVLLGTATLTAGGDSSSTVFSGAISGNGGFTKAGSGTMQLSGVNGYGGATTVNGGTLQAGIAGAFSSNSAFTVANGATLDLNNFNQTLGSLAGGGSVLLGTGTLTAGGDNSSTVFSGTISGNGGFTKAGSGTMQLSGVNDYGGATTVNGGTLQAGAAGAFSSASAFTMASGATLDLNNFDQTIGSLAGGGSVLLGTATLIAGGDSSSTVFSGTISGNGGFSKAGSGTMQLSGVNGYGGATTVNGGTLRAGIAGAFSSNSAFTVANGATLDLNNFNQTIGSLAGGGSVLLGTATLTAGGDNSSTDFSGTISGNGGFTKAGTGTMQLSGVNGYGGATTVSGGTLRAGIAGAFSSNSAFTVANGATLDLNSFNQTVGSLDGSGNVLLGAATLTAGGNNSSTIFSGAISGSGGFTKAGSGTMQLSGVNGYGGATTVNGGTLQAGIAGAFSSASAFMVATGATLDLNSFNQTIGSLGGSGNVLLGAATLTAGGNNSSTIFSGAISGSGGFAKAGSGTLRLTGVNSYTGATIIDGGVLDVEGAIASTSAVTVNAGATLTGAGTIDPPLTIAINSGATLAPGNGTPGSSMTIDGNLTLQSGAIYRVQLDPATASFATVNGSAALGGATVNAVFGNGSYVNKTYQILTATGGVSGTFATLVNTNLPVNFTPSLSYDANHAFLNLAVHFGGDGPLSGNQRAVATALDDFFNRNGGIAAVYFKVTPAGLAQASGELGTASQQTTFDAMSQFVGLLTDPASRGPGGTAGANGFAGESTATRTDAFAGLTEARAANFEQRWNVWAAGLGAAQSTSGNAAAGSNNATSRNYAVAVGAERWLSPQTLAGFALAGGGTSFGADGQGSGRSELFQAGIHMRHVEGPAFISAALAYGWQDITTDRTVTIAGSDRLRASYKANAWAGRIEGGYRFVLPLAGGLGLSPYAAAQATLFDQPAYAEQVVSGTSAFALSYAARRTTDSRSELGLRSDKLMALPDGILSLRGRLAWAHDFNPDRSAAATFQVLPGASFAVSGASQARDAALATTSLEMTWTNGWSAAASFESELSAVTRAYAGKGALRYAW